MNLLVDDCTVEDLFFVPVSANSLILVVDSSCSAFYTFEMERESVCMFPVFIQQSIQWLNTGHEPSASQNRWCSKYLIKPHKTILGLVRREVQVGIPELGTISRLDCLMFMTRVSFLMTQDVSYLSPLI